MKNSEMQKNINFIHKTLGNIMNEGRCDGYAVFQLTFCVSLLCEIVAETNQIPLSAEEE